MGSGGYGHMNAGGGLGGPLRYVERYAKVVTTADQARQDAARLAKPMKQKPYQADIPYGNGPHRPSIMRGTVPT